MKRRIFLRSFWLGTALLAGFSTIKFRKTPEVIGHMEIGEYKMDVTTRQMYWEAKFTELENGTYKINISDIKVS